MRRDVAGDCGFGLDLAGYTTEKSSFVVIERSSGKATFLSSIFSERHETNNDLAPLVQEEVSILKRCMQFGSVAVDIPIDLQGLPDPIFKEKVWQLTLRSIDQKKSGRPPLADRIGAPVARFQQIMRVGNFFDELGGKLFETYPVATLRQLYGRSDRDVKDYKNTRKEKKQRAEEARQNLCKKLKIQYEANGVIGHDDLDAIICAVVALADDCECTADQYGLPKEKMPNGYRLLNRIPFDPIVVSRMPIKFDEWINDRKRLV
jgi:predicted nuclease with RNAse H fold